MNNSSKINHFFDVVKRLPIIRHILVLFSLGYSTCKTCGLPWKFTESHSVMFNDYVGVGCVCEHCWKTKSKNEVWNSIRKWYYDVGYYEFSLDHIKECFEKEWEETHNEN